MKPPSLLELAAVTQHPDKARQAANDLGGRLYVDERDAAQELPFRAMLTTVTDDLARLEEVGDAGLYVVCRRTILAGSSPVVGLFPLVRHPTLSHRQADAHWRDVHAPLALQHHRHMTSYDQLSVVLRLSGMAIDGLALCGFASVDDLRKRFFSEPDSRDVISADVRRFADTTLSPRRLICSLQEPG